jgi:hypothetical protein
MANQMAHAGLEREVPEQHLEQHDAQTEHIGAWIRGLEQDLLGRHVRHQVSRRLDVPRRGLPRVVGWPWFPPEPREAIVEQLHPKGFVWRAEHHQAGRAEIAMNEASLVQGNQSGGGLARDDQGQIRGQAFATPQQLVQPFSRERLHHQVR